MNAKTPSSQDAKKKPTISTSLINFIICAFGFLFLIAVIFNKPFGNFAGDAGWKILIWAGFVAALLIAALIFRKPKHKA